MADKKCTKCQQAKPLDAFAVNRGTRRKTVCRACCNARFRELRRTDPEYRTRRNRCKADSHSRTPLELRRQRRRAYRSGLVTRGLTVNGTQRIERPPKQKIGNLIPWLRRDDGEWGRLYQESIGKPWNWRGLSASQRYRMRYAMDAAFHRREYVRLKAKKMRQRLSVSISQRYGGLSAADVLQIRQDNETCHYCHRWLTFEERTIDHVVPLIHGGAHARGNVVVACLSCNSKKSSKVLPRNELLAGNAAPRFA